jgi:hypothetical protein
MNRYIILISGLCLLLGTLSVSANAQLVFVDPALTVECLDSMFWVDIRVDYLLDSIHSYGCVMYIDTSKVWPESVILGTMFDSISQHHQVWFEWDYNISFPDSLYFGASIMGAGTFVNGPGQLARIVLTCVGDDETPVAFGQCVIRDPYSPDPMEVSTEDGRIFQVGPDYPFGDANNDGLIDIADASHLINYLFIGGPEPIPSWIRGDVNCDIIVDIADASYVLNYLFVGGPEPCNPCE